MNADRRAGDGAQWMREYIATSSDNWAYVNGHVEFGSQFSELARQAAIASGSDETNSKYVSNMVARQLLPENNHVALGMLRGGRPQIWISNIDRNLVMSAVVEALHSREFVRPIE